MYNQKSIAPLPKREKGFSLQFPRNLGPGIVPPQNNWKRPAHSGMLSPVDEFTLM